MTQPVIKIDSSNAVGEYRKEEQRKSIADSLAKLSATVVAAGIARDFIRSEHRKNGAAARFFKTKNLNQYTGGLWNNSKIGGIKSFSDAAIDLALAAEELSPFNILRVFQASHTLTPLANSKDIKDIRIGSASVQAQADYYDALLKKSGHTGLSASHRRNGLILRGGALYEIGDDGSVGSKILNSARMVFTEFDSGIRTATDGTTVGGAPNRNRVFEKFRNMLGVSNDTLYKLNADQQASKFTIIGGKNDLEMYGNWARAYTRTAMESGYKVFDNPLGFIEEYADNAKFANSPLYQNFKKYANLNIFGGDYTKSTRELLTTGAKNIAKYTVGIGAGLYFGDKLVKSIADSDSAYDQGLLPGLATNYANARIKYAETVSDNFQELKANQEAVAEGSTSLMTLAGFPLAGAMLGGTIAYLERIKESARLNIPQAEANARKIAPAHSLSNMVGDLGMNPNGARGKRYAMIGAAVGALFAAPYLPGALVGESSEELKKEYSGEKEVAVKSSRWWMSGGYEFEGTKTKYFRKHWYANLMDDGKDKALYGNDETKDELNPFANPFDYLRNPYRFEEMHKDDMPYPVWGMDVSEGAFFGKAYEKTIGAIIKPDKLNPYMEQAQKAAEEYQNNKLKDANSGIFGNNIDSSIDSFRQSVTQDASSRAALEQRLAQKQAEVQAQQGKLIQGTTYQTQSLKGSGVKGKTMEVDLSQYTISAEDADTLTLVSKNSDDKRPIEIRLSGIDAPEIGDHELDPLKEVRYKQEQLYGKEAADVFRNIISQQKGLRLVINSEDMSYGRYVGVVLGDNNSNLNLELIKKGAASALPWDENDLIDKENLLGAQEAAKQAGIGMWQYARYHASNLFDSLTGDIQTNNTYARIDKLAERKELAQMSGIFDKLGSSTSVSSIDENEIRAIAESYRASKDSYREVNKAMSKFGIKGSGTGGDGDGLSLGIPGVGGGIGIGPLSIGHGVKEFVISKAVSEDEKSLIEEGKLLPHESAKYDPTTEGVKSIYKSFGDFMGIKGWAGTMVEQSMGLELGKTDLQLARSGEATNSARAIKDLNIGGAFGLAESQRRIINTSSEAVYDRANPIKNKMPSWLPNGESDYYVDFSTGNPYDKIENGAVRLPGVGYAAGNPELEGVDPERYPLIHKYKILSDVALGSQEYYDIKKIVDRKASSNQLTDYERSIYDTVEQQSEQRSVQKRFKEYKTDEEWNEFGVVDKARGKWWEFISHNSENPLESLTFFRPAAKLIHARTATEDYQSQMMGSDVAMWTNPYSHFLKPTANKIANIAALGSFTPGEVTEQRNVNEYFDKLNYLKWRKVYNESVQSGNMSAAAEAKKQYQSTTQGAITTGLDTKSDLVKAYKGLDDSEKPYFSSFSQQTDEEERAKILSLTPEPIANIYKSIWRRNDYLASLGDNATEADLQDVTATEDLVMKSEMSDLYNQYESSGANKTSNFREYVQDADAAQYIQQTTGVPDENFSGWDPRLDVNDVKLKTLQVGKEDVRQYGFWATDEAQLERNVAINSETQVVGDLRRIQRGIVDQYVVEARVSSILSRNGFDVQKVTARESKHSNISVRTEKQ